MGISDYGPAYDEVLHRVIARLRRAQPRNQDTWTVCSALEAAMRRIQELEQGRERARQKKGSQFDRNAYMREYMRAYMRRRRAKAKKTD